MSAAIGIISLTLGLISSSVGLYANWKRVKEWMTAMQMIITWHSWFGSYRFPLMEAKLIDEFITTEEIGSILKIVLNSKRQACEWCSGTNRWISYSKI
jgi:hypothetical protein